MTVPTLRAEGVARSIGVPGSRFSLVVDHFTICAGARVAVVGPSGCGKSTLLGLLALALRPDTARALDIAGSDAMALWQSGAADALAALRSRRIGFVAQTGALLPFLTLRANIALPQAIGARPDRRWADALAERLGITAVLDRMPQAVSVGQRQRAAIARALVHRPALILADEPTASVHPAQADVVLALLCEAATEQGTALVITTHDAGRAQAAGFDLAPCDPAPSADATRIAYPS